jgi:hypothetical protein
LAHIFRNAETFIDKIYSSVCAICISIPIRAHEVLQLRLDCEVYGQTKDPESGSEVETYGIRVWPGKGNPPQVKWVPTLMVPIVKEAVRQLSALCSDARAVAAWYESHPDQIWLPAGLEHYRKQNRIPRGSVPEIIGIAADSNLRTYFRKNHIDFDDVYVDLSALEKAIVQMNPPIFHFTMVKRISCIQKRLSS